MSSTNFGTKLTEINCKTSTAHLYCIQEQEYTVRIKNFEGLPGLEKRRLKGHLIAL